MLKETRWKYQDCICYSVPKLTKGPWFEELQLKGIELTDFGTGSSEIELLIGSNLAGKLLSGIHKFDQNSVGFGIVAMNYSIGWTLMGQTSNDREESDASLPKLFSLKNWIYRISGVWISLELKKQR